MGRCLRTNLFANSKISNGEKFKRTEQILDRHRFGPVWLKNALIAQLVVESILKAADELQHYILHSYSVMPNLVCSMRGCPFDPASNLPNRKPGIGYKAGGLAMVECVEGGLVAQALLLVRFNFKATGLTCESLAIARRCAM